ncbi:hypothetical protein VTN49DRAFT_1425 [Thermomyces lanuginosus]|uniref:uncharacterized protein n=1 Tax=Thermomyces lanuginosus TaxID=5541 RepID=UPI00374343BF
MELPILDQAKIRSSFLSKPIGIVNDALTMYAITRSLPPRLPSPVKKVAFIHPRSATGKESSLESMDPIAPLGHVFRRMHGNLRLIRDHPPGGPSIGPLPDSNSQSDNRGRKKAQNPSHGVALVNRYSVIRAFARLTTPLSNVSFVGEEISVSRLPPARAQKIVVDFRSWPTNDTNREKSWEKLGFT